MERTSKAFPSERKTKGVKVIHCRRSLFPPSARKWPKGEREVSVRFRFNGRNGPLVRSSQMAAEEFSYWKKWDPRSAPLKEALRPSQNFLCMRPTNNFIFAACCNQAFLPIPLLALPAAASFAGETKEKQTKKRERFFAILLPVLLRLTFGPKFRLLFHLVFFLFGRKAEGREAKNR